MFGEEDDIKQRRKKVALLPPRVHGRCVVISFSLTQFSFWLVPFSLRHLSF